jgi:biotin transporter BioY
MITLATILHTLFWILLITISARLSFLPPGGTKVPITGQTLVINLLAYYEDPFKAFMTITIYVILVLIGVPFGARKAKHTQGYLVGFIISVSLLSYLFHLQDNHHSTFFISLLLQKLGTFFLGEIIVIFFGATVYWYYTGSGPEQSIYPFVIGDIIKIIAAIAITTVF